MNEESAKRKILYVITMSGGGGATRYVYDLASNLPAEYEPIIAAGPDGGGKLHELAEAAGIRSVKLKHLKREIHFRTDRRAIAELRELFTAEQPSIIHLNSTKAAILGSRAARRQHQIVYTAHGWVFKEKLAPLKRFIYRQAEKSCLPFYNQVIVLSEADHADGLKLGIPAERLHLIRNGIQQPHFIERGAAREEIGRLIKTKLADRKLIFCMALFFKTKGLNYLLDALKLLKSTDCVTVIFGDGILREQLEQQMRNLGLQDRIYLPGYCDHAAELIKAADVFVLPSVKEGLPYAILESIEAQVPIVATRVGGVPEILDYLLVDAADVGSLARAIDQQLEKPRLAAPGGPSFTNMLKATIACYKAADATLDTTGAFGRQPVHN